MLNIQTVLLCGGKGERLRPYTETIPKPLININNKPILSYIIEHILFFGMNDIIIATGYQSKKIEKFIFQEYSDHKIQISNSGNVDIIERIKNAADKINTDFILFYGDTLSDIKFPKDLEKFKD